MTAATIGYQDGVTDHSEVGAVPVDDEAVEEPPAVDDVVASGRDREERGGSDQSPVDAMARGRSVNDDGADAVAPNEPA